ncbi:transcriptional regulator family: Fungal Specific TF [Paecilomyces variotii]|nr:transcriptional regulator family: Fungal Specific TF [Paecilomyces variotii]
MESRRSPARSLPRRKSITPQLSCELCRKRKVKCDKLNPCTSCASSGTACVPIYRTRLPRGRHVNNPPHRGPLPPMSTKGPGEADRMIQHTVQVNEDLPERIYRLEALIQSMKSAQTSTAGSQDQSAKPPDTSVYPPTPISSSTLDNSTAPRRLILQRPDQFWADLVDEIHGLHDVIKFSLGEGEEAPIPSSRSTKIGLSDNDGIPVLGLGGGNSLSMPPVESLLHDSAVARQLCGVYLQQVDPVIKILHRPSVNQWMVHGKPYLAYAEGHPATEALGSAICYSAVSSMTENQCSLMFHTSKAQLMVKSRMACEAAIGRAGLLSTRDITVLQAFVLYLVAMRSEDRTQCVWTLIAVAVRIGKGLGLYLDLEIETFFDQQMRRRLWFTICLMDLQASFFQASEPLISVEESASTALPHHINDSDFDPTTTHIDPYREGLTDTTFALVTYHAQRIGRLLNFARHDSKVDRNTVPTTATSTSSASSTSHSRRHEPSWSQHHTRRFEEEALRLLHFCDPETSQYAWFTWHGTQSLIATARLAALRPLQHVGNEPPPRREGSTELLRICLQVLEKANLMHTDPRAEGLRWYVTVPWHALALAMAECYVSLDAAMVQNAWPLIESSYLQYEATRGGTLSGPLSQLMRRMREKLAGTAPLPSGSLPNCSLTPATATSPALSGLLNRPQRSNSGNNLNPSDSPWLSTGATTPAGPRMPSLPSLPTWHSMSLSSENLPSLFTGDPPPPAVADGLHPDTETIWEELFAGVPFNDIAGPDTFFDMNWT